jgi:selT/selW/selH-like putative selenoprotein
VRAADEVLAAFDDSIDEVEMVPSHGGVFEVSLDDRPVYSKQATGRHVAPGELAAMVGRLLGREQDLR